MGLVLGCAILRPGLSVGHHVGVELKHRRDALETLQLRCRTSQIPVLWLIACRMLLEKFGLLSCQLLLGIGTLLLLFLLGDLKF